jgi:hypothetical protein
MAAVNRPPQVLPRFERSTRLNAFVMIEFYRNAEKNRAG